MAIPGLEVTYPLIDKGPGNPNIPPGGSADAQAVRAERLRQAGAAAPTATTSAAAPSAPSTGQRLRSAGSNLVSGAAYLGAGVAGQATARSLRDVGGDFSGPGAVVGERQAGDSASSTQIPVGGPTAPQSQPYNFWSDSEAGRNIGNMANAVAPLGGVAMAARVPGSLSRAAGLADAALTGLASGVRGEREAPTPVPSAPSLRVRPEDTFAGPPVTAMQSAAPTTPGGIRRIDRPGASPLFTNMPDGGQFGNDTLMARGQISAQNMAAADALAGTQQRESLARVQAAEQPVQGPTPASLRQQAMGMIASRQLGARKNARMLLGTADAMEQSADRRYGADSSLRGTMYSADSQLGGKRMEMQQRLRQQQLMGEVYRQAGGDPVKAAQMAAGLGLDGKQFTDMAAADQTRGFNASKNASSRLESLAVRPDDKGGSVIDPGRLARVNSMVSSIAPNFQQMDEESQGKVLSQVEAGVNLVEGMNDRRNTGFLQAVGWDGKSPSIDKLPDMKGGKLRPVGLKEGLTTFGGVSTNDYVVDVGGHQLYLPRDKVGQRELELLKARGVDISGANK